VAWIEATLKKGSQLADEVEVFFVQGTSVSADLKRRKISLATRSDDCGLAIRTIRNGRIGASSTNDPLRWEECLKAALASGELATEQAWGGLPQALAIPPASDVLCFDPHLTVEPQEALRLLETMLDGAQEHPADVMSGSATLSSSAVTIANSNGLDVTSRHTGVSVSLEAIAGQSTGSEFAQSCFMDIDPFPVGERAAFFASRSAGGRDIPTGTRDVLLSPIAYAELLGAAFVPALSGRNVHAGRSRLAAHLNEVVTDTRFSLYDDPSRVRGLGSALWDAEGVPARRIDFVKDGILSSFAYDLRTAYRYGKESTGSATRSGPSGGTGIGHHNLIVDGPRSDITQEPAVYVHSVVGAHTANPMSGDFSVEISNAFHMENGEFGEPIRSAMLAGNVFDMHKNITGFSKEVRQIGSLVLPSIRLSGMHVIGK
jgi:PmbA protein